MSTRVNGKDFDQLLKECQDLPENDPRRQQLYKDMLTCAEETQLEMLYNLIPSTDPFRKEVAKMAHDLDQW
ncbi:MAG: hypothetical protein WCW02_01990 [Candidatus Buchananbacteria bacterium]